MHTSSPTRTRSGRGLPGVANRLSAPRRESRGEDQTCMAAATPTFDGAATDRVQSHHVPDRGQKTWRYAADADFDVAGAPHDQPVVESKPVQHRLANR